MIRSTIRSTIQAMIGTITRTGTRATTRAVGRARVSFRAPTRAGGVLLALLAAAGCGGEEVPIPEAERPAAGSTIPPASPDLAHVPTDTVQRFTGPGGEPFEVTLRTPGVEAHLFARIGRERYPLPLRSTNVSLAQYPCASCHAGVTVTGERTEGVHENIDPVHPSESGHLCTTCHVADSVELVRLPGGQAVSLDHAYRLCAQCHSSETRSWAAGVHGKRLEGWRGRRVVMNCADCHDPHRPELEIRLPYPGPQLPR